MSQGELEQVVETGGLGTDGFADVVASMAQEEAAGVVADLARVHFRRDQVLRVLRALSLPVPGELEEHTFRANAVDVEVREVPDAELQAEIDDLQEALESATAEAQRRSAEFKAMRTELWEARARLAAVAPDAAMAPVEPVERPAQDTATREASLKPFDALPVPSMGWEKMPAWADNDRKTSSLEATARQQGAIVAFLEETGSFMVPREVMDGLAAVGVSIPKERVAQYMKALTDAALIVRTGVKRRAAGQTNGQLAIEHRATAVWRPSESAEAVAGTSAPAKAAEAPSAPLTVAPSAQEEGWVRDFVVKQTEPFAPSQVAEATEIREELVRAVLPGMIERGVVRYVGLDDLELYEYVKPSGPGAAAEFDAKTRVPGSNGSVAEPVAGTGGHVVSSNPEVRTMLEKVRAQGGTFVKTGGGHISVKHPSGKRERIAHTPNPNGLKDDRAKLRRLGFAL